MKKALPILTAVSIGLTLLWTAACSALPSLPSVLSQPEEPTNQTVAIGDITLNVSLDPLYFSPDGDGENDELSITLGVTGGAIASWTFDILQPESSPRSGQIFKHFEGAGVPNDKIVWDGRSDPFEAPRRNPKEGEAKTVTRTLRVESATNYPYAFSITDDKGVVSEPIKGIIQVDILLLKTDDNRLQIRVPSIVFRSNAADFKDLPDRVVANNQRVITRIAAALNRFPDYKVSIEGHANPENAPGTKARVDEEKKESAKGSLSEKRASAILNLLSEAGVDKKRMTALGWGVSKPVADFTDSDNSWRNRRVEFFLDKK